MELLVGAAMFAGVLIFFQHVLNVRDRRHALEDGLTASYEEHCGARIAGGRNFTVPFVRVSVYPGFLTITCLDYRHALTGSDIASCDLKRSVFGTGLRIQHRDNAIPGITLWPLNATRLEKEIRKHILA